MSHEVDAFHRRYYDHHESTWTSTQWLGHRVLKCPLDLWIYQEIIFEIRPSLIVETGTLEGGSAIYLASLCDLIGIGEIVSIDVNPDLGRPPHPRVTYLTGSSVDSALLVDVATRAARAEGNVMVILDSDHKRDHVLTELHAYADLVTPGSYLVVEDTNLNGRPVAGWFGPGPGEAVDAFLAVRPDYERDLTREKFMLTFNPGGYLRRR